MAPWLRALAAFREDLASFPSTYMAADSHLELHLWGPKAIFWSPQLPGMHMVHRHTCRQNSQYILRTNIY